VNQRREFFQVDVDFSQAPANAAYCPPGRASDRNASVSLVGGPRALSSGLNFRSFMAMLTLACASPAIVSKAEIHTGSARRQYRTAQVEGIPGVIRHLTVVRAEPDEIYASPQNLDDLADALLATPDVDSVDDNLV